MYVVRWCWLGVPADILPQELFYFEPSEQDIIKVEVWDEKRLSDSFMYEMGAFLPALHCTNFW